MIAMTFLLAVVAIGFCAFALFTVLPALVQMPDLLLSFPLAQLIAFRWVLAGFFLIFGLLYLLPTFFARTRIRRIVAGFTVLVLLGSGMIHGATAVSRGVYVAEQIPEPKATTQAQTPQINLLSFNTKGGATSTAEIVQMILEHHVNVAVLPETSTQQGEEIRAALLAAGVEFQQFDTATSRWEPDFSSTVLLISKQIGTYRPLNLHQAAAESQGAEAAQSGTESADSLIPNSLLPEEFSIVGAAPENAQSGLPRFYGVHPIAPLPSLISRWKEEISAAYGLCGSDEELIIAGDFNSTADHQQALGADCRDSVKEAKTAGLSTWPVSLPLWLGTPIDRVLTNGTNYRGSVAKVVEAGESDHRGIIVQLRPHELSTASVKDQTEHRS